MEKVATEGFTWEAIISLYKSSKSQSLEDSSYHRIQAFHRLLGQLELAVIDAATKEVIENHLKQRVRVLVAKLNEAIYASTSCLIRLETSILHGQKHLQCFFKPGKVGTAVMLKLRKVKQ